MARVSKSSRSAPAPGTSHLDLDRREKPQIGSDSESKWAKKAEGVPLAPHDVRRTFAKLAHRGRAPLEQIPISLGHASIQTTGRYLGVQQNLTDAPYDHLGIRVKTSR